MTQTGFVQLSEGRWPSGDYKVLAHLELEPAEISDRLSFEFTRATDDLGLLLAAGLQLASGRLLMFLRYSVTEVPGTSVLVDANDDEEAAGRELRDLLPGAEGRPASEPTTAGT